VFKCKGNEINNKFNAKIQDGMDDANTNLEANAVDSSKATLSEVMSTEWHKLILLTDISKFGWKTVEEYIPSMSWLMMRQAAKRFEELRRRLRRLLSLHLLRSQEEISFPSFKLLGSFTELQKFCKYRLCQEGIKVRGCHLHDLLPSYKIH